MRQKSLVRTLSMFILPLSITLVLSIIIGLLLNNFASNKYKEMYIDSNLKISKHQAFDISHNKEDEVLLIKNLEQIMRGVAETVIEERDTVSNTFLRNLSDNFDLGVVNWYDNESNLLNSSNVDLLGIQIEPGSSVDLFNKGDAIFLNEGIRKTTVSENYHMFIYLKDEVDGHFVQVSMLADDVYNLTSRNSPDSIIKELYDKNTDDIISIALADENLDIVASTTFTEFPEMTRTKSVYEKALAGETITRIRPSTNFDLNVLEIIVPVYFEGEIVFIISTLYSLDSYISVKNSITLIVFLLAVLIILASFTLTYIYIIKPLQMLEKSIITFDPITSKYQKPEHDYYIFKSANQALENLSAHVHSSNLKTKSLTSKLYEQSTTDYLTKLSNRRSVIKHIEDLVKTEEYFSVLFIDLDGFKIINDTKGHKVGDEVLVEIAEIFKDICSECKSFVSRYGGDEFIIVVDEVERERIDMFLSKTYDAFKDTIYKERDLGTLSLSVGISMSPKDGNSSSELIRKADLATYEAKKYPDHKHIYYYNQLDKNIQAEIKIKNIVEKEIENDGFKIVLQPQVNVLTNEIVSYEALARLKHHNIYPNEFIEIAEKFNLINKLGIVIIDKTIDALLLMQENNIPLKTIYINFSKEQLKRENIDYLLLKLKEHNFSSNLVGIEITESSLIETVDISNEFFKELKKLGFKVAIDDFGSGSASIKYLSNFELALVKLDRSFSDQYLNEEKLDIFTSVVRLAENLGYDVLAEGIEDKEQVDFIKKTKCQLIQGYYYYRPMELAYLIKLKKEKL